MLVVKGMLIVDCDVHIHELPEELGEFTEMPWRKAVENVRPGIDEYNLYVAPGISAGTGDGIDPAWPGGQNRPYYVVSPSKLRKDLNSLGIDIGVLFPDHLLKLAVLPDADYAMALARGYNRWLASKWLKTKGFFGAICTAPQDPEGSAEEIRRYANDERMKCVYLPAAGVNPLYGNRKYDPVYEAAQKADLPVVLHGLVMTYPVFPCQVEQYNEIGKHALGHSLEMVANMVSVMTTGLPERFPKLKLGFMEGGISWVPWIMLRLNNEYFEWKGRLLPFLKQPPSHYFKQNIYYATQPIEEPENSADYMKIIELIGGAENILFASDWPHHDFDSPSKLLSYPIPLEVKRKILGENAVRFFKLNGYSKSGHARDNIDR